MLRSLLIMIVAGWAAAATPFRGDQSLFTESARSMARGKVLYRDLWDVTNPGVYWFYELSGSLFGFTEDGIHFGEWLWFTAFVFVLGFAILKRFEMETWPQSPAIFVGAWYYFTSCADPSHLTKTEGLVAFPMFVSLWAATHIRWPWLVLAGVAAGVVVFSSSGSWCASWPAGFRYFVLADGGHRSAAASSHLWDSRHRSRPPPHILHRMTPWQSRWKRCSSRRGKSFSTSRLRSFHGWRRRPDGSWKRARRCWCWPLRVRC